MIFCNLSFNYIEYSKCFQDLLFEVPSHASLIFFSSKAVEIFAIQFIFLLQLIVVFCISLIQVYFSQGKSVVKELFSLFSGEVRD